MRPQEAHRQIMNLLWNRYIEKRQIDTKSLADIRSDIMGVKPAIMLLHKKRMLDEKRYHEMHGHDIDDRSGEETYGYGSLDDIKSNLVYISDRFNCAFRLRWMLDLIKDKELLDVNV